MWVGSATAEEELMAGRPHVAGNISKVTESLTNNLVWMFGRRRQLQLFPHSICSFAPTACGRVSAFHRVVFVKPRPQNSHITLDNKLCVLWARTITSLRYEPPRRHFPSLQSVTSKIMPLMQPSASQELVRPPPSVKRAQCRSHCSGVYGTSWAR